MDSGPLEKFQDRGLGEKETVVFFPRQRSIQFFPE